MDIVGKGHCKFDAKQFKDMFRSKIDSEDNFHVPPANFFEVLVHFD